MYLIELNYFLIILCFWSELGELMPEKYLCDFVPVFLKQKIGSIFLIYLSESITTMTSIFSLHIVKKQIK